MSKFRIYSDCKPVNPGETATDDEMAKKLWILSEEMVKAKVPSE